MRNNHLSKKTKKSIIITGIAVVCVGIVSAVAVNANSKAAADKNTSSKSSAAAITLSSDSVSPNSISGKGGVNSDLGKTAFNPETESSRSEPLTTFSKPSSKPPKPTIEGGGKNGKQPTNSALTDKSKKPAYKTTPKAPTKKSSGKSNTSTKKSTSGSNYDPIFGNKRGTGAGGQGTVVDGDWGGGEQVGIMD